uniref:histone H1-like n=1 Tax=Pristiophorus japonicus TaxID=55135 RepID=UPI00398F5A8D
MARGQGAKRCFVQVRGTKVAGQGGGVAQRRVGSRSPALSLYINGGCRRPATSPGNRAAMADTVAAKAELPAPPAPALPLAATSASALAPAAKKKAAYRPQKGVAAAVAEQILEAVAATKERQAAPKLGSLKKTISASGYEPPDKAGVRPSQSVSTTANKGSPAESGAGTSSTSLHPDREEEEDGGEEEAEGGEDGAKGGAKSKGAAKKPARKRAAAAKPAAHKRAKKPAAKNSRKGAAAKPRKAPKRSASSRTGGRKRRAPKRR